MAVETETAKTKSKNREDFMKRWFAIALSVGFATALARMPWISEQLVFKPELPVDWGQVNQLLRLTAAAIATLLSWEGYLLSIQTKPLIDSSRFYIDVLLVSLYLILLLTSASPFFWVWIHFITFLIYIIWDFLSIRVHTSAYVLKNKRSYKDRKSVYAGLFRNSSDIYHGPIVTLVWPIYLGSLAISYQCIFTTLEKSYFVVTTLYFVLVIFGLFMYRRSKGDDQSSVLTRLLMVAACSVVACSLAFGLKHVL